VNLAGESREGRGWGAGAGAGADENNEVVEGSNCPVNVEKAEIPKDEEGGEGTGPEFVNDEVFVVELERGRG